MRASAFSDAQKAFILRRGRAAFRWRGHLPRGWNQQATYFNWKQKYDGWLPTEMRRLKLLEDENAKLRKLVADLSLDCEMLQVVIAEKCERWSLSRSSPAGRRYSGS